MTVTELLEALGHLYKGATAEALKVIRSTFYANLRKHEGEALQSAFDQVVAVFKSGKQPFPLPIDFLRYLKPELAITSSQGAALDLKGYQERKRQLIADWDARQGLAIRQARGDAVYRACWLEVQHRAGLDHYTVRGVVDDALGELEPLPVKHFGAWSKEPSPIILSAAAIETCERRVVSAERLGAHGAYELGRENSAKWENQMWDVQEAVRRGESPSKTAVQMRTELKPIHVKRPVKPKAKGLPPEHMAPKPEDEFAELDT